MAVSKKGRIFAPELRTISLITLKERKKIMSQEEKQLLLQDLCARLPYGVKIELMPVTRGKCTTLTTMILRDYFISDNVNYLPYLRPMSSMTEEEEIEYDATFATIKMPDGHYDSTMTYKSFDWLNAHHFDYRGLIEKGLAIEVTNENNSYEARR